MAGLATPICEGLSRALALASSQPQRRGVSHVRSPRPSNVSYSTLGTSRSRAQRRQTLDACMHGALTSTGSPSRTMPTPYRAAESADQMHGLLLTWWRIQPWQGDEAGTRLRSWRQPRCRDAQCRRSRCRSAGEQARMDFLPRKGRRERARVLAARNEGNGRARPASQIDACQPAARRCGEEGDPPDETRKKASSKETTGSRGGRSRGARDWDEKAAEAKTGKGRLSPHTCSRSSVQ